MATEFRSKKADVFTRFESYCLKDSDRKRRVKYRKVAQDEIFMEQKMRFGLVLGQLAILKKNWGLIMSNF